MRVLSTASLALLISCSSNASMLSEPEAQLGVGLGSIGRIDGLGAEETKEPETQEEWQQRGKLLADTASHLCDEIQGWSKEGLLALLDELKPVVEFERAFEQCRSEERKKLTLVLATSLETLSDARAKIRDGLITIFADLLESEGRKIRDFPLQQGNDVKGYLALLEDHLQSHDSATANLLESVFEAIRDLMPAESFFSRGFLAHKAIANRLKKKDSLQSFAATAMRRHIDGLAVEGALDELKDQEELTEQIDRVINLIRINRCQQRPIGSHLGTITHLQKGDNLIMNGRVNLPSSDRTGDSLISMLFFAVLSLLIMVCAKIE